MVQSLLTIPPQSDFIYSSHLTFLRKLSSAITASSSFVDIATRQPTLDYLPTFSPLHFIHFAFVRPCLFNRTLARADYLLVITHMERLCSRYTRFTPTCTLCCWRVAQQLGCWWSVGGTSVGWRTTLRHPQFMPHFATKRGVSCSPAPLLTTTIQLYLPDNMGDLNKVIEHN